MKILISWSSGKDAAWMLHLIKQHYPYATLELVTTMNQTFDRVAMHAVRRKLLEAQAKAVGFPLNIIPLPWPCSNSEYQIIMSKAFREFALKGFTHMAFGDLFLEDVRRYRQDQLKEAKITALFPLWKTKSTHDLAHEMIEANLQARLTCIDPEKLDGSFAGRTFDSSLLKDLPKHVDPCGENGEFHTFAFDGPMFYHSVHHHLGEIVKRDNFVFADICQD